MIYKKIQEKKNNIQTWGPFWTIFRRGLGTHKIMGVTWGTFKKYSNITNKRTHG
jgi:hypothetical protein